MRLAIVTIVPNEARRIPTMHTRSNRVSQQLGQPVDNDKATTKRLNLSNTPLENRVVQQEQLQESDSHAPPIKHPPHVRHSTGRSNTVSGPAAVTHHPPPPTKNYHRHKRQSAPTGFNWGNEKIRGVNLGGWLLLEPWITPSIFRKHPASAGIVDEYTLCKTLGRDRAHDEVLRPHWESWITLADFEKIAHAGFNVVRIPIGFWAFDNAGSPYARGAAAYLDKAVGWARRTGAKVVVDLHGVQGSQNGFDNSGHRIPRPLWQTGEHVGKSLETLKIIQRKYGAAEYDDVIAGIELVNEPLIAELDFDKVKQYERRGYKQQRDVSDSRVVVIQDGFVEPRAYNGWLTPSDDNSQYVAIDHHDYQVFTDQLVAMTPAEHREYVCSNAYTYSGADKRTFVGEWSAAMTDCAVALNGWERGARYDGTFPGSPYVGSCKGMNDLQTWSQGFKDDTRWYIETQMDVFEANTQGWMFWTWRTEDSPAWDAQRLIDAGVFPQPLTARRFGAVCGSD